MNINQDKLQDFINDLNKTIEELVLTPEDQEKVNVLKIKHDELFCGFDTACMNIELTRIQNQQRKEEMIKEKLIEAVSKAINTDKEAPEDNIEDANPIKTLLMLFTVVGWSHFEEALLWLPAKQLIRKMFSSRKGHIKDVLVECKIKIKLAYFLRTLSHLQKLIDTTLSL